MIHELFINNVAGGIYGVFLEKAPVIPSAQERGVWQTMPGRNGSYFVSEGAYDSVSVSVDLYIDRDADIEDVIAWIRTAQTLRVSPFLWEWKVLAVESFGGLTEWLEMPDEGYDVTVSFLCEPYRYEWPERWTSWGLTSNMPRTNYANSGTADAQLRIQIVTKNAVTMTLGDYVITTSSTATAKTYTIDCDARTVTNAGTITITKSGASQLPAMPKLLPGSNYATITGTVDTGSRIQYRKRWL